MVKYHVCDHIETEVFLMSPAITSVTYLMQKCPVLWLELYEVFPAAKNDRYESCRVDSAQICGILID